MGAQVPDSVTAEGELSQAERHSLIVLKNETKLVMEAFLRRMLTFDEAATVGHVGRYYHDAKKFISKTPESQDPNTIVKPHARRNTGRKESLEKDAEEKKKSLRRAEGTEDDTDWDTTDEEISQAEEKKHGFRTTMKRLIRRQRKKTADVASDKKSRDSLELLEDRGAGKNGNKADSKANSLKRQKSINPLIACAVGSGDSVANAVTEAATEESGKHSNKKKSSHQRFLNLFRRMSHTKVSDSTPAAEIEKRPEPSSPRPNTLPIIVNYMSSADGSAATENVEFYSKVAKKLDRLAQQYCHELSPNAEADSSETVNNNAMTDKEKMIEKIVLMLQEQGDGINKKIKEDPLLQRTMKRMSYRSFTKLVEVFTANVEEQHEGPTTSPELTKIALTMELTRRVAGISSHPVQQLMGYSMQYMDMFVPWLQENGGWMMVLPLDDVSEHQID
uniref:uncharacterized protein bcl2l12 n=1 Tax=Pristiophorus japonicus TaxID=55135 RepID=UPI00398F012D